MNRKWSVYARCGLKNMRVMAATAGVWYTLWSQSSMSSQVGLQCCHVRFSAIYKGGRTASHIRFQTPAVWNICAMLVNEVCIFKHVFFSGYQGCGCPSECCTVTGDGLKPLLAVTSLCSLCRHNAVLRPLHSQLMICSLTSRALLAVTDL